MGRGFIEQIHVSDRIAFLRAIDSLRLDSERSAVDIRLERTSADGAQFAHIYCEMTPIRDAEGNLLAIVAQSRDVSEEARLQAEAAAKAAHAESANDAKTRFLAAVSHELRTPLNAILGFSDVLAGEYFGKLGKRSPARIRVADPSIRHASSSVVNTMLDISKIEAGRYELLSNRSVRRGDRACEAMLSHQAREKRRAADEPRHPFGRRDQCRPARLPANPHQSHRQRHQVYRRGGLVTGDAALEGNMLKLTVSDTGNRDRSGQAANARPTFRPDSE
ncbi:hypothetical protein F2981_10980 [Sinorhizobium meliloti]|nr:hypothetical protein [Sinorhizobium meliloti]